MTAVLALSNGAIFRGQSIGAEGLAVGEVVFNTAMTGYQEVLTDPSYAKQLITFTAPHIGNTGVNWEDNEAEKIWAAGLIVREEPTLMSCWRGRQHFTDWIKQQGIIGISGVDTRALTRSIRDQGIHQGCIITGNIAENKALDVAKNFPGIVGLDLTETVSTKKMYSFTLPEHKRGYRIVVMDFGVKQSILRCLASNGCYVLVVPARTSAKDVLQLQPDGIVLSNGPGDPAASLDIVQAIRELCSTAIPILGICLGYQMLALAFGAQTTKMKFGHHGINHPIQDAITSKVYITSQNHSFMVKKGSFPKELVVTHRSLFDGSVQGIRHINKAIYGYQGHPEANPGPSDTKHIFSKFVASVESKAKLKNLGHRRRKDLQVKL